MKKNILKALTGVALFSATAANAQCPAGRYLTNMFGVTKTTVTYSAANSLLMDIYEPAGDAATVRPLIVLAHGGSFVAGTRTDDATIDSFCVRFARRGYVTASIDYRLGNAIAMALDSTVAIDVVMKAVSDGKAALRYFMKDAATTNTYRIDTNNIYAGGNSAGAVLYMHVGYLDSAEAPSHILTAIAANGGMEGNSGNAGYTTKCKAIVNMAGALNMASFVDATDVPSVNMQGSTDAVVPYNCAKAISGSIDVNLCGLGVLEGEYVSKSIPHWSKVFTGDGHVPWNADAAKLNTVDSFVKEYLYTLVCPSGTSVESIDNKEGLSLYPNPTNGIFNISAASPISEVSINDLTGRALYIYTEILKKDVAINTAQLAKGLYLVSVHYADKNLGTAVKRLIIE